LHIHEHSLVDSLVNRRSGLEEIYLSHFLLHTRGVISNCPLLNIEVCGYHVSLHEVLSLFVVCPVFKIDPKTGSRDPLEVQISRLGTQSFSIRNRVDKVIKNASLCKLGISHSERRTVDHFNYCVGGWLKGVPSFLGDRDVNIVQVIDVLVCSACYRLSEGNHRECLVVS
jgi:hypothetical protein